MALPPPVRAVGGGGTRWEGAELIPELPLVPWTLPCWASVCPSAKQEQKQLPGTGTPGRHNEIMYMKNTNSQLLAPSSHFTSRPKKKRQLAPEKTINLIPVGKKKNLSLTIITFTLAWEISIQSQEG